ncbi:hypothetical protein SAMN05444007_108290 [Cribrihabitans marinus]|uniref:Uncharacterized protein n=1 Tax=Cribrihabitans marinus TaxID=1227549 RepID=A0A1H7CRQ0_9RHOB|nr:hypothetical protein [Cribrihabitans marinus]GGH36596.1 hypothetical protein GCM10010973_30630 [Cribrihabitans marinus]SEJ92413.1 hypothetical protein SAMN05444007_108290 [Cribrihabitans marinus]
MLNTTTLDIAEARLGAAYAVEQHLRRHGASLCDLLDALDDPAGFAGLCDLHSAFGQPIPDTDAVEAALRDIQRVLADQIPSTLDRIGHERGLPASDMTLWHGARVSDLLARFRHAD